MFNNGHSGILGSFLFFVCIFSVLRSNVLLVHVNADAPPITLNITSTDIGTSPSFFYSRSARLDASGTKVLLQDTHNGPILCDAAPYVFLRRATGFGSLVCSFDGTEVSSASTARVYCRKNAVFYVFKFSDLSIVQGGAGGTQNPLIASDGTTIAHAGMFEFIPGSNYLFIASGLHDGTLYRVDTSTFTYSGTVSSTVTAQDPGNALEHYVWGACDAGTYCYVLSETFKVARFSKGTASVGSAHSSTIDLSARDKMNGGSGTSSVNNGRTSVVIDSSSNNLFLASTGGGMVVAKIALSTFTFSSRVVLSGPNRYLILCHNCFTAGNEYLMVLQYSAQKTTFIRVSDMTELTDPSASASAAPHYPVTAWISPRSNSGGIVAEGHGRLATKMISLVITNRVTPAPPPPPTSTPLHNNTPSSNGESSNYAINVILISVFSPIGIVLLIVGLIFLIYRCNVMLKNKEKGRRNEPDSQSDTELNTIVSRELPHSPDEEQAAAHINAMSLSTAETIDRIVESEEPICRNQKLHENLVDSNSLRQQVFQDLAVCILEDARKSSLEVFRNSYFNFFKNKIEIEQEAAQRKLVRVEMKNRSDLSHQRISKSLSIALTHFIVNSAKVLRAGIAYLLKTAPLRRVAGTHNITLSENIIQKLTEENVMESGEFEQLDNYSLGEMGIGKDDRLKILRLVRLHKDEALVDLRTENREMKKRAEETEKRSQLKDSLFSLQQEKSSLIMKLHESPEKTTWIDSINHSMNIQTATLDELQQAIDELVNDNADLARIVGEQRSTSSQPQNNTDNAPAASEVGTQPASVDGGDSQSASQTGTTTTLHTHTTTQTFGSAFSGSRRN